MKKNKKKVKLGAHTPQRPAILAALNMGYLNAATIQARKFKTLQIIVAVCGGTDAYMVQHIGHIMHVLYQDNIGVHLTLADPDIVKEENIGRQLFCQAEIGQSKAEALARRYGHAWGLNVSSYIGNYDETLLMGANLTVLVGCVNNAAGRKELHETLQHNTAVLDKESPPNIWWLDTGSLRDVGRVMLGTAYEYEQCKGAFIDGACIAAPSPALQSPGLLVATKDEIDGSNMSCAAMTLANLQSLHINAKIAVEAADMLTRLVVTRDLTRFSCEINLHAGTTVSHYATPEEIAESIRKPVSYLSEPVSQKFFEENFDQQLTAMVLAMQ